MAKIIAILNSKGGAGKSTISSNLARCLQIMGNSVLIADSDPQGTLRDWRQADHKDIQPSVVGVDRPTLHKDLPKVASSFDFVIIDGAAKLQEMVASSVKAAHTILIPVQPSAADIWGCRDLVSLIKARQEVTEGHPKASFLINRQIKNTNLARDITVLLDEFELPIFNSRTSQLVVYAEALSTGTTVLDADPNGAAATEIKNISKELLEFIHG
ncbi:MAG: ParA family partition ATPase [Gammaproteobacteria bacterium]